MNPNMERLYNGIVKENPVFIMMLGMCPTLAVTTSAMNGLGMGVSTMAVLILSNLLISLLAGLALGAVNYITAPAIEAQNMAANVASYEAVLPGAEDIGYDDALSTALAGLRDDEYGRSTINEAVVGTDGSGNVIGYAINVTNSEAFDGTLSLSVGIAPDGTVLGIYFTELNETPGKGSLCDEPEFKDQFAGVQTDAFSVGGNLDGVSGATISSKSVVNAVNAALDFCNGYLK